MPTGRTPTRSATRRPGGDNPTPDQDRVDDIGKALGVAVPGQRGAEGRRQDRRARPAPLGARPGVGGRLSGQRATRSRLRSATRGSGTRTTRVAVLSFVSARSTSASTRSTTSSIDTPGRVDDDGIGAPRRAARPRASSRSGRARRARSRLPRPSRLRRSRVRRIVRRGGARAPPATRRGRSSRRRAGNTTVPMSRPSITTPPRSPHRALARDEHLAHARHAARRRPRPRSISGVRIARATSWPSIRTTPSPTIEHGARARAPALAVLVGEVDALVQRLPRHARDTSRRCRCGDSRAARATARATVPLPAPDGPSMAMIRRSASALVSHRLGDRGHAAIIPACGRAGAQRWSSLRRRALARRHRLRRRARLRARRGVRRAGRRHAGDRAHARRLGDARGRRAGARPSRGAAARCARAPTCRAARGAAPSSSCRASTPSGVDEPRLVGFARDLAAIGHPVLTVELPDLARYTHHAADDRHDRGRRRVAARSSADFAPDGRIGMMGISFAGGLSIVAAGRPSLANRVGVRHVVRRARRSAAHAAVSLHRHPARRHASAAARLRRRDHPARRGRPVVPADQVAPLREAILSFLEASRLDMVDKAQVSRGVRTRARRSRPRCPSRRAR